MPCLSRTDRNYTVGLIVLIFFLLMGAGTDVFIRNAPGVNPAARWGFLLAAYMQCLFLLAIITTLLLRAFAPDAGRIATLALNIVLLLFFPFGTIVGIYGLKKVDKSPPTDEKISPCGAKV